MAKAKEEFKKPATEVSQAEATVKSSQNNLSKWKAESINFTRHQEILTLNSLEDDLGSLDELLEESKNLFSSAQQAVDNAANALSALPQKISEHQQTIAQKQSFVQSENSKFDQISLAKNQKISFIKQVDQIQKQNESQTKLDPQNEALRQAGENFRSPWPFSKKIYNLPMQNFFPSNRNWCRQKQQLPPPRLNLPRY